MSQINHNMQTNNNLVEKVKLKADKAEEVEEVKSKADKVVKKVEAKPNVKPGSKVGIEITSVNVDLDTGTWEAVD
jgi:hypothetical protein